MLGVSAFYSQLSISKMLCIYNLDIFKIEKWVKKYKIEKSDFIYIYVIYNPIILIIDIIILLYIKKTYRYIFGKHYVP